LGASRRAARDFSNPQASVGKARTRGGAAFFRDPPRRGDVTGAAAT